MPAPPEGFRPKCTTCGSGRVELVLVCLDCPEVARPAASEVTRAAERLLASEDVAANADDVVTCARAILTGQGAGQGTAWRRAAPTVDGWYPFRAKDGERLMVVGIRDGGADVPGCPYSLVAADLVGEWGPRVDLNGSSPHPAAQVAEAARATWRKEPPTAKEAHECPRWWFRGWLNCFKPMPANDRTDGVLLVLDPDPLGDGIYAAETPDEMGMEIETYTVDNCKGEWAPCVMPSC